MKTLTLKTLAVVSSLVVLGGLSALPVSADTPKDESLGVASFESTKSRDEVQQEYFQAMKDASLVAAYDAESPVVASTSSSNIQRDDVYAETVEWMRTKGTDIGMGE